MKKNILISIILIIVFSFFTSPAFCLPLRGTESLSTFGPEHYSVTSDLTDDTVHFEIGFSRLFNRPLDWFRFFIDQEATQDGIRRDNWSWEWNWEESETYATNYVSRSADTNVVDAGKLVTENGYRVYGTPEYAVNIDRSTMLVTFSIPLDVIDDDGVFTYSLMIYEHDEVHGSAHLYGWSGEVYNRSEGWAPVPEPTTMLLFGAGLVGLLGFRRKKFKK